MLNPNDLLLMLSDGARTAEANGERGLANTLAEMTRSLAESMTHKSDGGGFGQWRQGELREIFEAASR